MLEREEGAGLGLSQDASETLLTSGLRHVEFFRIDIGLSVTLGELDMALPSLFASSPLPVVILDVGTCCGKGSAGQALEAFSAAKHSA